MAIQLVSRPEIKITLNNGEMFADFAPNFSIESFSLTRKLLEPNKFEFSFSKKDISLEIPDIKFDLREQLLGAKVECSVKANRFGTDGDWHIDEVEKLFYGYIQHIKLDRAGVKEKMRVHCTAFSPDVRMKQFPSCSSRNGVTLKEYVETILMCYSDAPHKFDPDRGDFDVIDYFNYDVNPSMERTMPYTVQYHETDYDFLKRLAKRYGEFFYFEDGTIRFGKMKEYDPITLRTGVDLEKYDYDLSMNHHTGIVLSEFDYIGCQRARGIVEKGPMHNKKNGEPEGEMVKSVYDHATDFFNNSYNAVVDLQSSRLYDEEASAKVGDLEKNHIQDQKASDPPVYCYDQRKILERYIVAETVICRGVAVRADLKLGSVIVIEDETNLLDEEATDFVQHEPLKVIELGYSWSSDASRALENTFVAIPQSSLMPPYLERDEHGMLTYGDFDIFPKCGPQTGRVYDNKDPLGIGRVRVVLSWQFEVERCLGVEGMMKVNDNITPWIRVSQPYGGYQHGSYLVPEIYDEVMVGFEHNNAERPYVISCVHNYVNDEPVKEWVEKDVVETNQFKAIRTRNGHTIEICDKGEHGYVKIYDENTHNYVVTYDTDKKLIRLESKGNIELKAGQDIILEAGNDIKATAQNDIIGTAENDMKLTAKKNIIQHALEEFKAHSGDDMVLSSMKDLSVTSEENMYHIAEGNSKWVTHGDLGTICYDGKLDVSVTNDTLIMSGKDVLISVDSINEVVEKDINLYSASTGIKAKEKIKFDATTSIDVKGTVIREN